MTQQANKSVTVRVYAAARAAAGQSEFLVEPGRIDVILGVIAQDNSRLRDVFQQCSFLIDGIVMHDMKVAVSENSVIDVLPPFAGG